MNESTFAGKLKDSLQAVAVEAPAGPSASDVLAVLEERGRAGRHANTRHRIARGIGQRMGHRMVQVVAASLILAIGVFAVVLIVSISATKSHGPVLVNKAGLPPSPDNKIGVPFSASVNDDFNMAALLGHIDTIPMERAVILKAPAIAAMDEQAAGRSWDSKLDLATVDFAMLPQQGDYIFTVSVPAVPW